jgi:Carboxypeptidase regulatory-like domain/TonB dependent receptor
MPRLLKFAVAFLVAVLAVTILPGACRAQTVAATIIGTVTDSSGAIVPGVTVTAEQAEIGLKRQGQSNANGVYVIPILPVGRYSVTAEAQGFKRKVVTGVVLQVNQEAHVDLTMEVGDVKETLTVTGEAAIIQTDTSSVGTVIDNTFNTQIPLDGRDFTQLIMLVPGANDSRSGGAINSSYGSGVSINGRDMLNNFMLDGASNNARQFGNVAIRLSIDAVQEFKVLSNMYTAEFGQAAFAQINLVSKGGTNAFHGSVFEFVRNNVFDGRNFFLPKVPELRRNQFGASAGGPIRKNKTFFFANFEASRERRGVSDTRTVPIDAWRAGDFSTLGKTIKDPLTGQPFPNNQIPTARFSKPSQVALNLWPKANFGTGLINDLIITNPAKDDNNQVTGRIDHELTGNDRIMGRFSLFRRAQFQTLDLPGFESIPAPHALSLMTSETHVFSPRLIGEARFSYARSLYGRKSPNTGQNGYFEQFGINHQLAGTQFEGAPRFDFQQLTMTSFGDDNFIPTNDVSNEFTYTGSLTYTHGQHTMKMGATFTKYQENSPGAVPGYRRGDFTFRGDFTGNAFADFLLGDPYSALRTVGTGIETGRSAWQAYYFQDDWKVTRKLTLNLGVRWDYTSPLVDIRDRRSEFYPLSNDYGTGLPGQIIVANSPEANSILHLDGIGARALYKPTKRDFGPRFGFGYSVTPKTVVRGGYGIFYANLLNFVNNLVTNRRQPPSAITQSATSSTVTPQINLADPFVNATAAAVVSTQNQNPNLRDGYVQQWNFTIQREIRNDWSFEAGYVGNKGTKLSELVYYNVPTPGPSATVQARRPFPNWGTALSMDSYVLSNYHSLQSKMQKRFKHGLSLLASYTWSKSIDMGSERNEGDAGGWGGSNQRDLHGSFRGLSGFDVRHRFSASYVYELPFGQGRALLANVNSVVNRFIGGWQTSGIVSMQSGSPFTVTMSGDQNGDGLSGDRPDVIGTPVINPGNPNCYIADPSNPACGSGVQSAFAAVPATAYRYGNAGRNILIGPGLKNVDVGLMKNAKLTERFKLQFRAEFFNLFNFVNFDTPNRNFNLGTFGTITSQSAKSREIQFGLKLEF